MAPLEPEGRGSPSLESRGPLLLASVLGDVATNPIRPGQLGIWESRLRVNYRPHGRQTAASAAEGEAVETMLKRTLTVLTSGIRPTADCRALGRDGGL
jgi:hypothetical protein